MSRSVRHMAENADGTVETEFAANGALPPDPATIADFFKLIRPSGQIVLCAMRLEYDDKPSAQPFDAIGDAVRFAERVSTKDLFFYPSELRPDIIGRNVKAGDLDVRAIRGFWVDIDPSPDEPLIDASERITEQIAPALLASGFPPTVIVATGRGLQAHWCLDKPSKVDGDVLERFRVLNKRLHWALGGDHTFCPSQILRVAGSVYYPDKLKQEQGAEPCRIEILAAPGHRHSWDDCAAAIEILAKSAPLDGVVRAKPSTWEPVTGGIDNLVGLPMTKPPVPAPLDQAVIDFWIDADPEWLGKIWNLDLERLEDQSLSAYDLSFCHWAGTANINWHTAWRFLIAFRKRWKEKTHQPDKVTKRWDYVRDRLTRGYAGKGENQQLGAETGVSTATNRHAAGQEQESTHCAISAKTPSATVSEKTEKREKGVTPLDRAAFYGIAGKFVDLVSPETEADPAALLVQFLAALGNAIGDANGEGPHVMVGQTKHRPILFAVLVGKTSKARKGTSWSWVKSVFSGSSWGEDRIFDGLSSGEGLIWACRDPIIKEEDGKPTVVDAGVTDKRLFVMEEEFANCLKVIQRAGNNLSATIRRAWDNGNLQQMTKREQAVATNAMISICGHITEAELVRNLDETESVNGFANRFIFFAVKRSNLLPFGGADLDMEPLRRRVQSIVAHADRIGRVYWTDEARSKWEEIYAELSRDRNGMIGALASRAEAQVLRLALVYALSDCKAFIELPHLEAAFAVWRYAEASLSAIWGDALGDPIADEILTALRKAGGEGMARNDIRQLFNRHASQHKLTSALKILDEAGLARMVSEPTAGRPRERWFAV